MSTPKVPSAIDRLEPASAGELVDIGLVRVHATERLTAMVSGSGLIEYRGNPDTIITDITGSGQIRER